MAPFFKKIMDWIFCHKILIISVVLLILVKVIWVTWGCWSNGGPDSEKKDILQRRDWLIEKVVVEPRQLLREMPSGLGLQFQGEWALYSCSMLAKALSNITTLYPETKQESINTIDSLIQIVKSPELRLYDKIRWGEDPLDSIAGGKSHVSYHSHLAAASWEWMLIPAQ